MPLFTEEELNQLPEFEDIDAALRAPEKVLRFRAYGIKDASQIAKIAEFKKLQTLSISLSHVSLLLPKLNGLRDLQSVYLQACDVPAFPESLFDLQHLNFLSIGNSSLRELPAQIGSLSQLRHLAFSQNELRDLPETLGQLRHLQVLNLSHNQIQQLPESITDLDELEFLLLNSNQLTELPKAFEKLSRLKSLDLNYNKLTSLTDTIDQLAELQTLSLESNPFQSLPAELANMEHLTINIEASQRRLYMDWSYKPSDKPVLRKLDEMGLFVETSSALHENLMRSLEQDGLMALSKVIEKSARQSISLESTVPDDYAQLGNSRLGGFPDLAHPDLFPTADGLHWIFLAQLNLADMAPLNDYLPRQGLLSFFIEDTESLKGKVLFYEGDSRALSTVRHDGAEAMISPCDDYTQKAHRVKFGRFPSCSPTPPEEADDPSYEAYYTWIAKNNRAGHHINGYTFTQHESPQEQAASKLRGQPDEWVPLLQLGWDSNVGFCFWDAGTITFCIHQEDLQRQDFSNVHISLESS